MVKSDNIQTALNRLKNITGFVTTLCRGGDFRPSVFNRYDHVNRVWLVNQLLCRALGADPTQSSEIVVLHDLNRWPFAQNSERGRFDQIDNAWEYLPCLDPGISTPVVNDVVSLHKKEMPRMRKGSKYALAADFLAGLAEDPLLITAGLNAHPELIPARIASLLCLDFSEEGIGALRRLCTSLNKERNIGLFSSLFQNLFEMQCSRLIDKYTSNRRTVETVLNAIAFDALYVKEEFLRPVVFPINNECVCHASFIQNSVLSVIINDMGLDAAKNYLLSVDEPGLIAKIREKEYVTDCELQGLYPDLDYTSSSLSHVKCFV
ncbi:MAG: hypothetical protein FWG42_03540 [Clostridiales bacterium]|nr:hypothetical protein [Clostridiales bacterium]